MHPVKQTYEVESCRSRCFATVTLVHTMFSAHRYYRACVQCLTALHHPLSAITNMSQAFIWELPSALLNCHHMQVDECVYILQGGRGKVGQGYKFSSVGSRFKKQLQELMDALHQMEPHYIRCIKPNSLNKSVHYLPCSSVILRHHALACWSTRFPYFSAPKPILPAQGIIFFTKNIPTPVEPPICLSPTCRMLK